jgi:alkylation response protein AidB-like acyl-CoA dehydrogenase
MAIKSGTVGAIEQPLAAARRLSPRAGELAEQIERERALPPELVGELLDAGLFSLCLPRSLGGREAHPAETIEALEELARGDGATAWCAMVASTSSVLGAYLPRDDAELVYAGGRAITGGVFAPHGRAERRDGVYVVSGHWSFVSGITHCDWVLAGCVVHDGEEPVVTADGTPEIRLMLLPVDSVEVLDTWAVSGLRGTASHDMTVTSQVVPAARSMALPGERPRHPGALYLFPLFGLLAAGIAAVALGIARGAIEDLVELAGTKTPIAGRRTLAERSTVQAQLARSEASLRAARALLLAEADGAWEAAEREAAMPVEHKLGLRLAATHATVAAAEAVTAMYHAGGGTSIYDSSPLQRRFRAGPAATQHIMVAPATWELTGRVLFGLPSDTRQL